MRIGIMQGRLSPPEGDTIQCFPRSGWAGEFAAAARAGLDAIEWIYDAHGEGANPLASDAGVARIHALAAATGVAVRSVCADWLMEHPLLRAPRAEREAWHARLGWLLGRCAALGAARVVLPFVDAAAIRDALEADAVVDAVERALPAAVAAGVELHLETALGPEAFAALLDRLPHPLVRANYDAGNSAALGYHPSEEFAAYGARVGSVHVKDRVRGGGTVPLGAGDADLQALFAALRGVGYAGDVVLQVARGVPGDEVAWAAANRARVEALAAAPAARALA